MEKVVTKGQVLFGIAIVAFGVENLACARFGLGVSGVPWFPANPFLAYLAGIILLVAGLSIAANIRARSTAILLGILFLFLMVPEIPEVSASPMDVGIRTVFFETLALSSSAWILAGALPAEESAGRWGGALNKLIRFGSCLFGASSVVFGIDHFFVLGLIASLVPAWMHGGMFWAYFTGVAFIAAGISIVTGWMDQLAGLLLGTMFLLWFLLLHVPRTVTALLARSPGAPDEWSSAFIALGLSGGAWLCAWSARQRRLQRPGG